MDNHIEDFFQKHTKHFNVPHDNSENAKFIDVITTYKGERLKPDFFEKNPDKQILYPDKGFFFTEHYLPALKSVKPNHRTKILVTENGVSVEYEPS
jgi:hypothetical protein